jgi:hypothetical protein
VPTHHVTKINGVASSEVGKAIRLRFPRSHAHARRAIMAFDSKPTESLIPNDGDLIFDATTGEGGRSPAETVLPYIEQRADPDTIYRDAGVVTTPDHADYTLGSPEENNGSSQGIIIDWSPGDGSKGETVGVIAIISPAENNYGGHSVLEFSIENHPNNPSHGNDVSGRRQLQRSNLWNKLPRNQLRTTRIEGIRGGPLRVRNRVES